MSFGPLISTAMPTILFTLSLVLTIRALRARRWLTVALCTFIGGLSTVWMSTAIVAAFTTETGYFKDSGQYGPNFFGALLLILLLPSLGTLLHKLGACALAALRKPLRKEGK